MVSEHQSGFIYRNSSKGIQNAMVSFGVASLERNMVATFTEIYTYGNHPLKKFYPEFNFDLSQSIDKYPFRGLNELAKEGMMRVLRNGNLAQAEMIIGKKTVPVLITANPQFKGLDVYDKSMSIIRQDEIFPKKDQELKDAGMEGKKTEIESNINAANVEDRFPWENEREAGSEEQEIGR